MEFSVALYQRIEELIRIVREDPLHEIRPIQRLALYNDFGRTSVSFKKGIDLLLVPTKDTVRTPADLLYAWLAIIIAQHVLPIWEEFLPNDLLPHRLIKLAEASLTKTVNDQELLDEMDNAYNLLGNYPDEDIAPTTVNFAGCAALQALWHVKGFKPFENFNLTTSTTDEGITEWGVDVASWTVKAYAGICEDNFWTEICDPQKRLDFWMWWLEEAIPKAWELTAQSD